MDLLANEAKVLIQARDERFEAAGLLPLHRRRSSFEILRDVKRRREQERSAA
jgi:hypothetical protein